MRSSPIDALVVSSWYPSIADPVSGRFVADQVEALAASGRVRPVVVSIDHAELLGSAGLRARLADRIAADARGAIATRGDVFNLRPAPPAPAVPTARLPMPRGRNPGRGPLGHVADREAVLGVLAGRWVGGLDPGVPLPDIVHAHTVIPDGAAAATLAAALDRPLVITEHASFLARIFAQPPLRARYAAAAGSAARLLVVGRVLAAEIEAELPELAGRITIVPNAVDVSAFSVVGPAERHPDELVFVGYRRPSKGIATLLEATALVRRRRPGIRLRLIGGATPEDEARWTRRIVSLGIRDAVSLEPAADRVAVAAALARAALFVHPSPRETFGVVAVEALASGLPVVAADSGGVTEILGDRPQDVGAIVPPGDAEALAAAIETTLDRRLTLDPRELRRRAESRYGAASVAGQVIDVYRHVLDEAGSKAPSPHGSAAEQPARGPAVSGAGGAPRRMVVVAFNPERAALLATLPEGLRGQLIVVTSRWPGRSPVEGVAATHLADLGGRGRMLVDAAATAPRSPGLDRWLRVLRHPIAFARRRGWLPGLGRAILDGGTEAIRAALAEHVPDGRADIVAVDGLDHLAVAPFLAADSTGDGLELAPGGLAWLADRGLERPPA
ncbi:MAG: glycosyltransferase [Chloroflexi bacterium]|nr:glycosyltransferase [Chloroflexota bacterium]